MYNNVTAACDGSHFSIIKFKQQLLIIKNVLQ